MLRLTRYVSAMALICVLACGKDECPAGTMQGISSSEPVCKVPGDSKVSGAGAGGRTMRTWPTFEEAGTSEPREVGTFSGSGGSGGSSGAGGAGGKSTAAGRGSEDVDADAGWSRPTGPVCGNGIVEQGEACDGASCPLTCDTGNACIVGRMTGSRDDCDAKCEAMTVTACADGDGCCAAGCDHNSDDDCSASRGNGAAEPPETRDGDCPSSCDDKNACTADKLTGSASTCNIACTHTKITQAKSGDGCCPAGANATSDTDCEPKCGNGAVEQGETCDGNCGSCDDKNPCTTDTEEGSAEACTLTCRHGMRSPGSGCGGSNRCDSSGKCVAPSCGDGVVDSGERCDGNCPKSCAPAGNECDTSALVGTGCQVRCEAAHKPAGSLCDGGRGVCDAGGKCVKDAWYTNCGGFSDCSGGLECQPVRHICSAECTSDSQCGNGGSKCVVGWCEQQCATNADCKVGQECADFGSDHVCRPQWCGTLQSGVVLPACPSGFTCQDPDSNNISECLP